MICFICGVFLAVDRGLAFSSTPHRRAGKSWHWHLLSGQDDPCSYIYRADIRLLVRGVFRGLLAISYVVKTKDPGTHVMPFPRVMVWSCLFRGVGN